MLKKIIPLSALAGLLVTGIMHGRITDRWRYSDTLQSALSKLPQLPLLVGNWDGTILEVDTEGTARRGAGSYVSARFVNRLQGDVVYVTLVCGRPGPLSLHPPTICLPAHGFSQNGAEVRLSIPLGGELGKNEFCTAEFLKTGVVPEHTRFYWSYSAGGRWSVPADPRISLAGHPAVYKLYFFHRSSQADDPLGENPCLPFLRAYVPELQKVLFPS
jgi:hypothetical protein